MDRTTWRLFSLKSVNDIFSLENENHIILPKDVKMSQDIHAYLNKTNFYVECMHWDKHGILDGFIDHKQNMYPSNNECDIGKSICDKLFNKYKTHDFKWSNQSYTSIASSLYKHMRVYSTYLKNRRAFLRAHACIRWTTIAWAHQIWWRQIENSRKVPVLFKGHFVGALNTDFPTKNVLHDKNRTFSTRVFSCRFFSSRFSWSFKDFKDSTPKITVPV